METNEIVVRNVQSEFEMCALMDELSRCGVPEMTDAELNSCTNELTVYFEYTFESEDELSNCSFIDRCDIVVYERKRFPCKF